MGKIVFLDEYRKGKGLSLKDTPETIDDEMMALGVTSPSLLPQLEHIRSRVGEIIGIEYILCMIERILNDKPLFSDSHSCSQMLPYQYRVHLEKMNVQECDLVLRFIQVCIHPRHHRIPRLKRDVLYLRNAIILHKQRITSDLK